MLGDESFVVDDAALDQLLGRGMPPADPIAVLRLVALAELFCEPAPGTGLAEALAAALNECEGLAAVSFSLASSLFSAVHPSEASVTAGALAGWLAFQMAKAFEMSLASLAIAHDALTLIAAAGSPLDDAVAARLLAADPMTLKVVLPSLALFLAALIAAANQVPPPLVVRHAAAGVTPYRAFVNDPGLSNDLV